jgi:hypothetical protein
MLWVLNKLTAFLGFLCRVFQVPAERMDDHSRTDLPPAEGGVSSLRPPR